MEDLQIPTQQIPVEVHFASGERSLGVLFVGESPYHPDCSDALLEMLNDERAFVPYHVREPAPGTMIVNKTHLRRVRIAHGEPGLRLVLDDAWSGEPHTVHTLLLEGGTQLLGELAVDTRRTASRPLDKLNQAGRFIKVLTDGGTEFVQLAHIVQVA